MAGPSLFQTSKFRRFLNFLQNSLLFTSPPSKKKKPLLWLKFPHGGKLNKQLNSISNGQTNFNPYDSNNQTNFNPLCKLSNIHTDFNPLCNILNICTNFNSLCKMSNIHTDFNPLCKLSNIHTDFNPFYKL